MLPISDTKTSGRFPFWVAVIILINIYVFILEITAPDPDAFIATYALIPANINFNDYSTLWPFISSQFLHGGFLHIISNMWFFRIFGDNVENRLGFLLFPIFYLTSGVVGALAQYLVDPSTSIPMLGASGAIAGVLGAYLGWFGHHSVKTLILLFGIPAVVSVPASLMLLYWFGTQLFSGAFSITSSEMGGVAYLAHIGGFAFGYVFSKLLGNSKQDILTN